MNIFSFAFDSEAENFWKSRRLSWTERILELIIYILY